MSFPGWISVHTHIGPLPIEDIVSKKLPVRILTNNHGLNVWGTIQHYKSHPPQTLIRFVLTNGTCIETTPEQKIYTAKKGYVSAQQITEKDRIVTLRGLSHFKYESPTSIEYIPTPYRTHELVIVEHHTYFTKNILVKDTMV